MQKIGGRRWNFSAKSAGRCFTPVMEIKPNRLSLRWNFYADIQLIRGRFWLQLWTVKKFSEPRVSWNTLLRCGKIQKCRRRLQRRFVNGRTDRAYLGGRHCVGRVHGVVCNASAVTRGAGHMLSEKSQRTQNGTMFVDLDWPLNALRRLSASAELLVHSLVFAICLSYFNRKRSTSANVVCLMWWGSVWDNIAPKFRLSLRIKQELIKKTGEHG